MWTQLAKWYLSLWKEGGEWSFISDLPCGKDQDISKMLPTQWQMTPNPFAWLGLPGRLWRRTSLVKHGGCRRIWKVEGARLSGHYMGVCSGTQLHPSIHVISPLVPHGHVLLSARSGRILRLTVCRTCPRALRHNLWVGVARAGGKVLLLMYLWNECISFKSIFL